MRPGSLRLYTDLAWLWPLWGDHETEYAGYCEHVVGLFRAHAQRPIESVLVISCGSGKNVFNLKRHFRVTGLDLSPVMLELAAELNPECEFVEGDMCDFELGRTFDAILLDDGVSHMTHRADLAAAFRTAFRHLNPGGVMVVTPDVTTEDFCQNRTVVEHAEAAPARRTSKWCLSRTCSIRSRRRALRGHDGVPDPGERRAARRDRPLRTRPVLDRHLAAVPRRERFPARRGLLSSGRERLPQFRLHPTDREPTRLDLHAALPRRRDT
jgi:SAM-dependent methyltransferase